METPERNDGRSLASLNEVLERAPEELAALQLWLNGIPVGYGYRTFKIRKKGKGGFRIIDAPNPMLLMLQKSIYQHLLKGEAIPTAANGFVVGRSIAHNARPHVNQAVVINVDLKDFFHSISANRVYQYWRYCGWGDDAVEVLTRICCYRGRLPQGAPTSPALSNVVNRFLDQRLESLARGLGGRYTRYADDITFSFGLKFDAKQRKLIPKLRSILAEEGYEIQEKKRVRVQRSHQRQTVTGLVVNQRMNIPRTTRQKIRSWQYKRSKGLLQDKKDLARLAGYEALLHMIKAIAGQPACQGAVEARREKKICYFSQTELEELYDNLIKAKFSELDQYQNLFISMNIYFEADLPHDGNPGPRLRNVLNRLNQSGRLDDGELPLETFLKNAAAVTKPRPEALVFEAFLQKLHSI